MRKSKVKRFIEDMKRRYEVTIFIDMDGVLAKWDPNVSPEETYEPDFFLKCQEEEIVINLINELSKKYRVKLLSHVYGTDAVKAKTQWLEDLGLGHIDKMFVPYGNPKSSYVWGKGKKILIDDYSKNLHDWVKSGYVGIKFYNQVNGTKGTWNGPSVKYDMPINEILDEVNKAINY